MGISEADFLKALGEENSEGVAYGNGDSEVGESHQRKKSGSKKMEEEDFRGFTTSGGNDKKKRAQANKSKKRKAAVAYATEVYSARKRWHALNAYALISFSLKPSCTFCT